MDIPTRGKPVCGHLPLVLLLALGSCRAERAAGRDLVFESTDGYSVGATEYAPAAKAAPGIILLPMAGSSREAWAPFQRLARSDGYFSIAIDLRGHGETKTARAGAAGPGSFSAEDWLGVLDDVAGAKRALIESGADPGRIAVAGASIGANLALRYASIDPEIHAVVMLSPGEEYRGVATIATMESFTRRPVLMMAALGDAYAAASVQKLDALAKDFCELRLYPGAAHGTDLLAEEPVAADQVLMWLDQIFSHMPGVPK